ncbi:oxidative stress transcriptional regulator AosR [Mycolicibacterium mengxianglii]|uniref:oxidative stress transcriptional regulator AosR n=1 Tax=Mycolicibacterium mengxianglii TaxID=2736649 RepID=UPI0018D1285C|nr:DUF2017 domain-containing protein [Mycolicibacterium mengxianglii]
MRKWKRVETAAGTRFRSALEPHEAALLQNMVTSMVGMLDERESSSPSDELEQITGMRTGHTVAPEDATLGRLLPDFFRPQNDHPAGSAAAESLNSALRSLHEPDIIDAKRQAAQRLLATCPEGGGRFELTEDDANAWLASVNDVRLALGSMLDVGSDGPDALPPEHPMAGHLDVYQWLTVLQEYLVLSLMNKPLR